MIHTFIAPVDPPLEMRRSDSSELYYWINIESGKLFAILFVTPPFYFHDLNDSPFESFVGDHKISEYLTIRTIMGVQ